MKGQIVKQLGFFTGDVEGKFSLQVYHYLLKGLGKASSFCPCVSSHLVSLVYIQIINVYVELGCLLVHIWIAHSILEAQFHLDYVGISKYKQTC